MEESPWWTDIVIYQIYPRSYMDSNNDGVGDLRGIESKTDYIAKLGVDAVWLNPVYRSPQADYGYDVQNYREIHPEYGDMNDMMSLIDELHSHDIAVIMDYVPNHTSREHRWFMASKNKEEHYKDYYIWRDPIDGGPPNNWESFFGGPAWTYDDEREQYYLHLFDENQPDLNWDNSEVREEVKNNLRFWIDKDVDGFRLDVINLISKPPELPDGAPNDFMNGIEHVIDGPNLDRYLGELHRDVFSNHDLVTIGEMPGLNASQASKYAGKDGYLSMAITFEHVMVDRSLSGDTDTSYDPQSHINIMSRWQQESTRGFWPCLYWNNHDNPRSVSRFGDDEEYREESAKMLATVLLTQRGTPILYMGEEIGMTNTEFPSIDDIRDVEAKNRVREAIESGEYSRYGEARSMVESQSRDNARTPMQWSTEKNAGFTEAEPWIKVNPNYTEINTETDLERNGSILKYYRELIQLRHNNQDTLIHGDFALIDDIPEHIYAYHRTSETTETGFTIINNLSKNQKTIKKPGRCTETAMHNYDEPQKENEELQLRPYESLIYNWN